MPQNFELFCIKAIYIRYLKIYSVVLTFEYIIEKIYIQRMNHHRPEMLNISIF